MSVGGSFQLLTNNGVEDHMLMATNRLLENIKNISKQKLCNLRAANPGVSAQDLLKMEEDWMPTLQALARSHVIFINSSYKPFVAITHEYSKTVPRQGKADLGATFSFTLPLYGEFINDAVMYVKLTGLAAVSALDKVRYVEYLGHKLAKKVRFKVQNHPIDEYGTDEQNAYFQFKVPYHKEAGYLRNIGQEQPKLGYLSADPTVDEVREYRWFGDGYQTFKQTHATVELWIPILFWFKDVQTALPNFILPKDQTDIEVTFDTEANLVSYANYGGGGSYTKPTVSECCLYVNHLFVLPAFRSIFISRFGYQLIRVHRKHSETLNADTGSVLLHQIKWPVESLYIAFRPQVNSAYSQRWHKNTHITAKQVKEAVVTGTATIQVNNAVYLDEVQPVSKIELLSHDITIYPALSPDFYNNYIPLQYGSCIKTPRDLGWYMMNFNLKPGEFQPSGHINVSKSRELYLKYTSAIDSATSQPIIRSDNPADLIVLADCLNFLAFKGNNVVLRFAT